MTDREFRRIDRFGYTGKKPAAYRLLKSGRVSGIAEIAYKGFKPQAALGCFNGVGIIMAKEERKRAEDIKAFLLRR